MLKSFQIAGAGLEPASMGNEPIKGPLLYPASIKPVYFSYKVAAPINNRDIEPKALAF